MAPFFSLTAFCSALLYTFSNTRGTARMNVGRKAARAGSSSLMSPQCPSTIPASTQPTSMTRAKTCASGRNSSVPASSGAVKAVSGPRNTLRTAARKFS